MISKTTILAALNSVCNFLCVCVYWEGSVFVLRKLHSPLVKLMLRVDPQLLMPNVASRTSLSNLESENFKFSSFIQSRCWKWPQDRLIAAHNMTWLPWPEKEQVHLNYGHSSTAQEQTFIHGLACSHGKGRWQRRTPALQSSWQSLKNHYWMDNVAR